MRALRLIVGLSLLALAACGDDSAEDGGTPPTNDVGEPREGCFDCADTEYCIIESGETEAFYCVEPSCEIDCDCMTADAAERLEVCRTLWSCQEGGDIFYCYEE